jgi:energy-coupling factor transport system ATP-binding protein
LEIIKINDLSFSYPKKRNVLTNISLSVSSGEFIVILGGTGCGKTTFLKLLKPEISPVGEISGLIKFKGVDIDKLDKRESACEIGFVMQNPEMQIVTDKVKNELAFGLENMGTNPAEIRRRVAEVANFFGINSWYGKNTSELSGGQKQILNLASVIVMQPKLLILDEPTSHLDPIAASEFIALLKRLNDELGITIIISEHRLEEVFPIADRAVVMENGRILFCDTPRKVCDKLRDINNEQMLLALPSAARIYNGLNIKTECPLTIKEGIKFITDNYKNDILELKKPEIFLNKKEIVVELKNVYFKYDKQVPDVLSGVNLKVYKGEILTILGGNGAGKTTTLNIISGKNRPYSGKVLIDGKNIRSYKYDELYQNNIALLPQNPQIVFLKTTVMADFYMACKAMKYSDEESENLIADISERLDITQLLVCHPYDLSGGEQQKAAIAKLLLLKPKILLFDEPTKAIDAYSKIKLSNIFHQLKKDGITIINVSHDIEFSALNSDRCAFFFDGEIVSIDSPDKFFSNNSFYTTGASMISRFRYKNVVTCEDVVKLCELNGLKSKND